MPRTRWVEPEELAFSALISDSSLHHTYHDKQKAVADDYSSLRAVIGTRRSGKSTVNAAEAIELADQFPGEVIPYLGQTLGRARDTMMPALARLVRDHGAKLTYNLGQHKVFTSNGGCIQLGGLATKAEAEKGRGGRYPMLIIDEAGAIPDHLLRIAVLETYGPATADFEGRGGRGILVSGTPGRLPGTFWEKLCGGNSHKSEFGASVHFMSIFDNPYFAGRAQGIIEAQCQKYNLTMQSGVIRREWLGEFCTDSEGLCYPDFNGEILPYLNVPIGGYTVLGVDIGKTNPCAWVVVRFIVHQTIADGKIHFIHHGHVLETYERTGLYVHEIATITKKFQQTYSVGLTVGDSGGKGLEILDNMRDIYGVVIENAKKTGSKRDGIWLVNSMFRAGTLHVHERCESLVQQVLTVPWNPEQTDHEKKYPEHSCDALMYAVRAAKQHDIIYDLPPVPGSREWMQLQQRQDAESLMQQHASQRRNLRLIS